jgi:hypothetical protein
MAEAYVREDADQSISQVLAELCDHADGPITVGDIVGRFGSRAFGALLFLFAAPNLLPLPPGSSSVLAAPLVLLSPQVAVGVQSPWLPKSIRRRRINPASLRRVFQRLTPWLARIEQASRPRLGFLFGSVGDRAIGVICTLLALVLILPIPLGNILPAAAISVLSLSLALRDGVLALVGYGLAGLSATVLALAAGVVVEAAQRVLALVSP